MGIFGLDWFGLFQIVFIYEFIFEVVFIFENVFIFEVIFILNTYKMKMTSKQAEAEVVPSSSAVQFKLESDLDCLRFIKYILD